MAMAGFFCFLTLSVVVVLGLTGVTSVGAEESHASTVEHNISFGALTDGYSDWYDESIVGRFDAGAGRLIMLEMGHQSHFDDDGYQLGVSFLTASPKWYAIVGGGSSAGGFFLPKARFDMAISKKWMDSGSLVSTIGATYYKAKDEHSDQAISALLLYYFSHNWIVESGMRVNQSAPGGVVARRYLLTVTFARYKKQNFIFRMDTGNEAYQITGETTLVTDFNSQEMALTWRQWLHPSYGVSTLVGHYRNPYYQRRMIQIGFFYEFTH